MERAVPEILPDNTNPLPNARINLSDLSSYENIFAYNNNATSEGRGFYTNIPTDWLYLLTGGYYNVFYSSRAADPTNQYVVLIKSKYGIGKGNITEKITPEAVKVFNNYPNPFGGESNKNTQIKFGVPYRAMTELYVVDILGRTVGEIMPRGYKDAGYYEAEFNGAGYASGVYFYRLTVGDKQIIKKMILAK